jgi:hypothetical protein
MVGSTPQDTDASHMLIEAPEFEIGHDIEVLALQGDWDLENQLGTSGGRWVISEPHRAHRACLTFMDRVMNSTAQLAMVPELAIPRGTVAAIIQAVQAISRSLVFLGGVEGLTRQEYESLIAGVNGQTQALLPNAPGNYVNAILIVVKTAHSCRVYMRAKRIPSGPENQGPPMARGAGPFASIRLGQTPLAIVPLVCSEFVWPEEVWANLDKEIPGNIDLIPVLQHNLDVESKHTGPQLHHAYTRVQTKQTRFVFVNQAISTTCDGTCYVVVPPRSPGPPSFDHAHTELWSLPGVATYRGFRIPDLTGCIWSARIAAPHAPTSALGSPFCEGRVTEVLTPAAAPLRGLAVGLMRSAAVLVHRDNESHAQSNVRDAVLNALDRCDDTYILRFLNTESANDVFYRMQHTTPIEWSNVREVVGDLIEGVALLISGGDEAVVIPCEAGNCRLAGRSLLVLYAPDADEALTRRFPLAADLDGMAIPVGVLLIGVQSGTVDVRARRIGDVLRADQVTSTSADLVDSPRKTEHSSVTIRLADVEFCSLRELKPNWKLGSSTAAQDRLRDLFPKVYA